MKLYKIRNAPFFNTESEIHAGNESQAWREEMIYEHNSNPEPKPSIIANLVIGSFLIGGFKDSVELIVNAVELLSRFLS
jgi:hypothetical protein